MPEPGTDRGRKCDLGLHRSLRLQWPDSDSLGRVKAARHIHLSPSGTGDGLTRLGHEFSAAIGRFGVAALVRGRALRGPAPARQHLPGPRLGPSLKAGPSFRRRV